MKPELEEYIEQHISPEPDYLHEIDRLTNISHLNGRMCSGHIQGRLLKMLTRMVRPKKVLELGTFTGYSALCIAEGMEPDGIIHTVEVDDELEDTITANFAKSPFGNKIKLHIGDALEVMEEFPENYFDMAIIDADKRRYSDYFRIMLPKMAPGGYIIADNTLWDEHVVENSPHSSQTMGILDFNDMVAETPGLEIAIIPIRDGLTIIRKSER